MTKIYLSLRVMCCEYVSIFPLELKEKEYIVYTYTVSQQWTAKEAH